MQRSDLLMGFLVVALGSACAQACAAGQDKKSRELVAVTRLQQTPTGSLSVSDDGRYEFVDFTSKREHDGELSKSEMDTLRRHLAPPSLEAVYETKDADPDRCVRENAGFVLHSRLGAACIVMTDVADQGARESLVFFSTLFEDKAAAGR